MTTQHTTEPWYAMGASGGQAILASEKTGGTVAVTYQGLPDAERIVACVNACAGMADPAREIAALRAERDELREALGLLVKAFQELAWRAGFGVHVSQAEAQDPQADRSIPHIY